MNNESIEFKKWCHICSQLQKSSVGVMTDHILTGKIFDSRTFTRAGQFLAAALFAGGLYYLNGWSGDGVWLLVAFAATSALLNIGLAVQSRTGTLALLNLVAVPILFATAYAGLNVAPEWLIVSFVLHGGVTAVQLSSVDKDLNGGLFFWSVFNGAMALMLLLA